MPPRTNARRGRSRGRGTALVSGTTAPSTTAPPSGPTTGVGSTTPATPMPPIPGAGSMFMRHAGYFVNMDMNRQDNVELAIRHHELRSVQEKLTMGLTLLRRLPLSEQDLREVDYALRGVKEKLKPNADIRNAVDKCVKIASNSTAHDEQIEILLAAVSMQSEDASHMMWAVHAATTLRCYEDYARGTYELPLLPYEEVERLNSSLKSTLERQTRMEDMFASTMDKISKLSIADTTPANMAPTDAIDKALNQVENLVTQLVKAESEASELRIYKSQAEASEKQLRAVNQKLAEAQQSVTRLGSSKAHEQSHKQAAKLFEDMRSQVELWQQTGQNEKDNLQELCNQQARKIAALNQSVAVNTEKVGLAGAAFEDKNQELVNTSERMIFALRESIGLSRVVGSLEEKVKNLEVQHKNDQRSIQYRRDARDSLLKVHNEALDKVKNLEIKISDLEQENEALRQTNSEVQTTYSTLEDDVRGWDIAVGTLTTQLERLQTKGRAEIDALESKIAATDAAHKKRLAKLKKRLHKKATRVTTVETEAARKAKELKSAFKTKLGGIRATHADDLAKKEAELATEKEVARKTKEELVTEREAVQKMKEKLAAEQKMVVEKGEVVRKIEKELTAEREAAKKTGEKLAAEQKAVVEKGEVVRKMEKKLAVEREAAKKIGEKLEAEQKVVEEKIEGLAAEKNAAKKLKEKLEAEKKLLVEIEEKLEAEKKTVKKVEEKLVAEKEVNEEKERELAVEKGTVAEKDRLLAEKTNELTAAKKETAEKVETLAEKDRELAEKQRAIDDYEAERQRSIDMSRRYDII